tara:strand:- start:33979 stop:34521 length:543 start_codon:yes stop_codon:yes gene_type:complete
MDKIFLDMDGVVANWCKGVSDWFGGNFDQKDVETWSWAKDHLGLSSEAYDEGVVNEEFWERLPRTDEFFEFLELIEPYKDITCILSSPSAAGGLSGKQTWIKNHLPYFYDNFQYLIGPAKSFCAGPGALLIDDSGRNCKDFIAAGGHSILVPRRWNKNWGLDCVKYTRDMLEHYMSIKNR